MINSGVGRASPFLVAVAWVAAAGVLASGPAAAHASVSAPASCTGTSFTWTGHGDDSSWGDTKNWNPSTRAPGGCGADSVTIPIEANITGVPAVQLASLTVTDAAGSDGTLQGGPISVSKHFVWDGSTFDATINLLAGSSGIVAGPANFKGLGGGGLGKPGRLNVAGSVTLSDLSGTATGSLGLGAGISRGVIDVQHSGVLISTGQDNLGGASCCNGPDNPTLINEGQIRISSGRLHTEGIVTSELGRLDVAARSLFDVDSPITLGKNSSYAGSGRMVLDLSASPSTIGGKLSLAKGFQLELGPQACLDGSGTMTGGGTFDFTGGYLPASLTIAKGTEMHVTGPGLKDLSTFACGTKAGSITDAGRILVDDGTLSLGARGSLATIPGGMLSIAPGATVTDGRLLRNAGTLRLAPRPTGVKAKTPATVSFLTLDNAGTIFVGASQALLCDGVGLTNSGDISVARGQIKVIGSYRQRSAGVLAVTIAGRAAGSGFGQLDVAGNATLAGELRVATALGFSPARGETFLVLRYQTRAGKFARLSGRPKYSVSYRRSGAEVIYH